MLALKLSIHYLNDRPIFLLKYCIYQLKSQEQSSTGHFNKIMFITYLKKNQNIILISYYNHNLLLQFS